MENGLHSALLISLLECMSSRETWFSQSHPNSRHRQNESRMSSWRSFMDLHSATQRACRSLEQSSFKLGESARAVPARVPTQLRAGEGATTIQVPMRLRAPARTNRGCGVGGGSLAIYSLRIISTGQPRSHDSTSAAGWNQSACCSLAYDRRNPISTVVPSSLP